MTDIKIHEDKLTVTIEGADKIWSFKNSLTIPLAHITNVSHQPEIAEGWLHGIRLPGTNIPGVITAGTFYQDGERVFWDVHVPDKTIVIELKDEKYRRLIIEVSDVDAAIAEIKKALV